MKCNKQIQIEENEKKIDELMKQQEYVLRNFQMKNGDDFRRLEIQVNELRKEYTNLMIETMRLKRKKYNQTNEE